jgi:hypothetical protein
MYVGSKVRRIQERRGEEEKGRRGEEEKRRRGEEGKRGNGDRYKNGKLYLLIAVYAGKDTHRSDFYKS